MPTKLKDGAACRRRVGQIVVTVSHGGVYVRLPRRRKCGLVSFDELLRLATPVQRSRRQAFHFPIAESWLPAKGSWVWVRQGAATFARGKVLRVDATLGQQIYRVRFKGAEALVARDDLRPAPVMRSESTACDGQLEMFNQE